MELLFGKNISLVLDGVNFECVDCQAVPISRDEVNFDNALLIDGWRFQWNGEGLAIAQTSAVAISETVKDNEGNWFKFLYLLIPIAIFALIFTVLFLRRKKNEKNH